MLNLGLGLKLTQVQASAPPVVFNSGLINNGGFDDASGWTLTGGGDAVISGGVFSAASLGGAATRVVDNATLVPSSWYQVDGTAPTNGGSVTFSLGGKTGLKSTLTTGAFTVYLQAGAVDNTLVVNLNGAFSVDNLVLSGPKTVTLGSSIIANGTYDDASSWTLGTNMSISGGTLNMATSPLNQRATNAPVSPPAVGTYYQIDGTVSARTGGSIAIAGPFANTANFANSGNTTLYACATGTANPYVLVRSSATLSFDNFTMCPMTFS